MDEHVDSTIVSRFNNKLNNLYKKIWNKVNKPLIANELQEKLVINNKYKITQILKREDEEIIYSAEDLALNRIVAIKMLKGNNKAKERLMREATVIESIRDPYTSPYVNNVFDSGTTEQGIPYLVMKHPEDNNLNEKFAVLFNSNVTFSPRELLAILTPLIIALGKIHAKGIIHNNLKPTSVVCTKQDTYILANFDSAIEINPFPSKNLPFPTPANSSPSNYTSPEQINGAPVNEQSDIYSLGVMIYYLIAGEFPSRTNPKLLHELNLNRHNITPDFSLAINKALSETPTNRQKNCQEFLDQLKVSKLPEPSPVKSFTDTVVDYLVQSKNNVPFIAAILAGIVHVLVSLKYGSFIRSPGNLSFAAVWKPFCYCLIGTFAGGSIVVKGWGLRDWPYNKDTSPIIPIAKFLGACFLWGFVFCIFLTTVNQADILGVLPEWYNYKIGYPITGFSWAFGLAVGTLIGDFRAKSFNKLKIINSRLRWSISLAIIALFLTFPINYYLIPLFDRVVGDDNLTERILGEFINQGASVFAVVFLFYRKQKRLYLH